MMFTICIVIWRLVSELHAMCALWFFIEIFRLIIHFLYKPRFNVFHEICLKVYFLKFNNKPKINKWDWNISGIFTFHPGEIKHKITQDEYLTNLVAGGIQNTFRPFFPVPNNSPNRKTVDISFIRINLEKIVSQTLDKKKMYIYKGQN